MKITIKTKETEIVYEGPDNSSWTVYDLIQVIETIRKLKIIDND